MSKRAAIFGHLTVPAALAIWSFILSLGREAFGVELMGVLLGSALFFAAPHLIWLVAAAVLRIVGRPWHMGLALSSSALVLVAVSPLLGSGDPSGLPYHWLVYWPLALGGQFVVGLGTFLRRRTQ